MAKKNYDELAEKILELVGTAENITYATHCMTRLRLEIKDQSIVKVDEIKNIPGLLGAQWSGGQFQIIVGPDVPKLYAEVCNKAGLAMQAAVNENLDAPKEKLTFKKVGGKIMDYLAGSITPLIPAMLGAGLCKSLSAILGPYMLNVIGETSNVYILLNFMYDGFFYFLPIMVGFNAAKKMNIPQVLGAYMGAVLLAPTFMDMVTNGTPFDIFGIPVTMVNYSQSVVPVILSVAFMGFLYKLFVKIMPNAITTVSTPFLTVLIAVPVSLLALAPMGTFISNAISGAIVAFGNATGFIGVGVIGAIYEFLVMTGMHGPITMPFLMDFFEKGYMTGPMLGIGCASWACFGVALGAFLRLKNKEEKSAAGGFFITSFLGGITEPTLYGLCMKHTRCFIPLVIGSFVGGAYLGITHVCSYVMGGASNFLTLISYTGGTTANLINGVIGSLLSMAIATVLTYFIGFGKEELEA